MLKRKGQKSESVVPRFARKFTRSEVDAYAAAFNAIKPEFEQLSQVKQQLETFPRQSPKPQADPFGTNAIIAIDGLEWQSQVWLLKLPASDIFLCRDLRETRFAIIQRFQTESPYAKANGHAEILLHGEDASQLVREYAAEVSHTLRFMASNAVTKAQRVAWENFEQHNPGKIVRAISECCRQVLGNRVCVSESETVHRPIRHARGVGI